MFALEGIAADGKRILELYIIDGSKSRTFFDVVSYIRRSVSSAQHAFPIYNIIYNLYLSHFYNLL
jgi:hypothetical protein